ncbi:MAG TPA: hypothetical protein VLK33_13285, partial [Terriglobales bacterium]|nr:hypothetical protein [Terriglobales bacterium]
KVGAYEVIADKEGFQRKLVDRVVLEVQALRTIDMVLPPGTVTTQVAVSATATAVQTTESSVGTLFESKLVSEIPLNGRNFLQLQLLSPGVTMGTSYGTIFSAVKIDAQTTSVGGGNFSVNGNSDIYNDYLLDGVSFKDWIHGTNAMNPSVDAIQEFRTQTSNYSADFGSNAGGLVNMVIKSGTNQYHGSVYEFLRNDIFDATNYFTKRVGATKTPLRRNQFGGTFGGPLIRNKTFYFGSYDGFREQRTTTAQASFPSAAMHHGDFSELLALPTPKVIHDPFTGNPYPGNIIPDDKLLSVIPTYLDQYIPLPNRPGLVNNYVVPRTRKNSTDQFIVRLDHAIKPDLQLFGHYAHNQISDNPGIVNPNFLTSQTNFNHNVGLELDKTISPNSILTLRVGYNLFKQFALQNHSGETPSIASGLLQITGVSVDPLGSTAPSFGAVGFSGLGGPGSSPRSWFSERYEYQGSLSLIRGKHMIRTGMHAVRHHETFPEILIPTGSYTFDGTFTGYSMADMMIGIPSNFQLSPELFDPQFRQWELMPWVQDDWRVTTNLTLNLGLRYEWRPWPISNNNSIANIVLPPGGSLASLVLSGPCTPEPPVRLCQTALPTSIAKNRSTFDGNDNNNFAPRIGFAYRLGSSGRGVIRGAYGIFYQERNFSGLTALSYNPPFVSNYNIFNNAANFQSWDWHNPISNLTPGVFQYSSYPGNSRNPYLQAWNLGVQRELGAGVVLDVAYVGNHDTKLWSRALPNQPRPGPGDINARRPYTNVGRISSDQSVGSSLYDGLQVRGDKRFSNGLSLITSYTWAKTITDSQRSSTSAPDLQDNNNRAANRGLWNADTRHRFTLSGVYELPLGKGKKLLGNVNGIANKMISGWEVAGIGSFQTGQPLTVTLSFDNPNVGEGAKLPNLLRNPNHGPKTVDQFFDTTAFELPPQYTFGNEGISAVTGPGLRNVDVSLIKNTSIGERMNVQFRAEAFNVGNHLIMAAPSTTFGTPNFGKVTSTRLDDRELQFALRITF